VEERICGASLKILSLDERNVSETQQGQSSSATRLLSFHQVCLCISSFCKIPVSKDLYRSWLGYE